MYEEIKNDVERKAIYESASSLTIEQTQEYFKKIRAECEKNDLYRPQ
jgi:hypothetical protein